MTEYLIKPHDRWHIARPGAITDETEVCNGCDHGVKFSASFSEECPKCKGTGRMRVEERTIRLAWFARDGAFICWDYDNPTVRELPDA